MFKLIACQHSHSNNKTFIYNINAQHWRHWQHEIQEQQQQFVNKKYNNNFFTQGKSKLSTILLAFSANAAHKAYLQD